MRIFLTQEILETILLFCEAYPNLYKIFQDKPTFVFDLNDDELDSILGDSGNDITQFLLGYDIEHKAQKGILDNFKNNAKSMMDEPRELFFLDVDEKTANKIRIDYGVLVISSEHIDDTIFDKGIFRYRVDSNYKELGNIHDSWTKVLQDMKMMPCNSIVISDSYMFNTANIDIKCCVKNIEGLLDAVLPQDFADTFHILLFTDEILGNNDNINKAIGDIKAYIKSKRSYDIILESVFYKSLHQRKIISNYNVILFDKGVVAFKENGREVKATGTNYFQCSTVYENAKNFTGQSDFNIITKDLKDLQKWYIECKDIVNKRINDDSKKILGTNNTDKSLNNRIINHI